MLTFSQNHVPLLDVLIPEHVRVAEVGSIACQYGVAIIFCECLAIVVAVCKALGLVLASRCVHGYNRTVAKSSCVVMVYNSRTGEYRAPSIGLNWSTLKFPVYKVG